jgi:uncharacterized protein
MKRLLFRKMLVGICLLVTNTLLAHEKTDSVAKEYEQQILTWHEQRIKNLKREHGWLSLIALDWLNKGENEIPSVGFIKIRDSLVQVRILPKVQATLNSKPFTSGIVHTDADTSGPDKILFGTRAFVIIKRGERYAIRMWDSNAETRRNFIGIDNYPISLTWRIDARWQAYEKPKKIKIASVISGFVDESSVPGVAIFYVDGTECRLEPIVEEGDKEFFFLFADKTNGSDTYGAGRFLYAEEPKGGTIILDFNKAYNPPCAFTAFATCPLPPTGNHLAVRIEAGEKYYSNHPLMASR